MAQDVGPEGSEPRDQEDGGPRRRSGVWPWVVLAIVVLIVILLLWWYWRQTSAGVGDRHQEDGRDSHHRA